MCYSMHNQLCCLWILWDCPHEAEPSYGRSHPTLYQRIFPLRDFLLFFYQFERQYLCMFLDEQCNWDSIHNLLDCVDLWKTSYLNLPRFAFDHSYSFDYVQFTDGKHDMLINLTISNVRCVWIMLFNDLIMLLPLWPYLSFVPRFIVLYLLLI